MLCTGLTWVATGGGFLSARYWTQFNRSIIVQNLSKEQNLPSEANSFSDSPEIIQILWNPKFIAVSTTALHFPLSKVCSSEPKSPGPRHSHYTDWAAFPFISIHVSTTYSWDLIRPWAISVYFYTRFHDISLRPDKAPKQLSEYTGFDADKWRRLAVQLTFIDKGERSRNKQTLWNTACHFTTWDTPFFFQRVWREGSNQHRSMSTII